MITGFGKEILEVGLFPSLLLFQVGVLKQSSTFEQGSIKTFFHETLNIDIKKNNFHKLGCVARLRTKPPSIYFFIQTYPAGFFFLNICSAEPSVTATLVTAPPPTNDPRTISSTLRFFIFFWTTTWVIWPTVGRQCELQRKRDLVLGAKTMRTFQARLCMYEWVGKLG